jgi:hypothetical protein
MNKHQDGKVMRVIWTPVEDVVCCSVTWTERDGFCGDDVMIIVIEAAIEAGVEPDPGPTLRRPDPGSVEWAGLHIAHAADFLGVHRQLEYDPPLEPYPFLPGVVY